MDFERLKLDIKSIAEIAESVPESFRDRCFDLLLSALLLEHREGDFADARGKGDAGSEREPEQIRERAHTGGDRSRNAVPDTIPITAQLRVLMRKGNITEDELSKILFVDAGEVHFVREPNTTRVATGQIEWSLLLALKNALLKNTFSVDPEDVRSIAQDKGFYDRGNFATNFKRNARLFKTVPVPQGPAEQLSSEGLDELVRLIKRLAGGDKSES